MTWIAHLRQRSACLLAVVALVLSLSLAACGEQANASNSSATNSDSTSQKYQSGQPAHAADNHGNTMQNVDQQVQGILRQLDGAQNDVNASSAAASQDGGQP